jgi:hypothetical protein
MLRDRIIELFKNYDPDIREVLSEVLDKEWARLSYDKPRGIIDEIRQIIDAQVRLKNNED